MHLTLICIFICDLICLLLGLKMHRFKIVCHYHLEVWFGSFGFLLFIYFCGAEQAVLNQASPHVFSFNPHIATFAVLS